MAAMLGDAGLGMGVLLVPGIAGQIEPPGAAAKRLLKIDAPAYASRGGRARGNTRGAGLPPPAE
jgi:hypothetical protein